MLFRITFIYSIVDNQIVDIQCEIEHISLNDVLIPNHYVGIKDRKKCDLI